MKTLLDLVCRAQTIHDHEVRQKNEQFVKQVSQLTVWYPQGLEVYERCYNLILPWSPGWMELYAYLTVAPGEQQEKLVEIRRRLGCTFEELNVYPKYAYIRQEALDCMSDEARRTVIVSLTPSTHPLVRLSYERQLRDGDRCRVNDEVQMPNPVYVDRRVLCEK